jgi:hypothetical protein
MWKEEVNGPTLCSTEPGAPPLTTTFGKVLAGGPLGQLCMPRRCPKSMACVCGPFDPCDVDVVRAESLVIRSLYSRVCFSFISAQVPT